VTDPASVADALAQAILTNIPTRLIADADKVADNIAASLRADGYEVNPAGTAARLSALTAAIGDPDEFLTACSWAYTPDPWHAAPVNDTNRNEL
jgi:hypothetical protein